MLNRPPFCCQKSGGRDHITLTIPTVFLAPAHVFSTCSGFVFFTTFLVPTLSVCDAKSSRAPKRFPLLCEPGHACHLYSSHHPMMVGSRFQLHKPSSPPHTSLLTTPVLIHAPHACSHREVPAQASQTSPAREAVGTPEGLGGLCLCLQQTDFSNFRCFGFWICRL